MERPILEGLESRLMLSADPMGLPQLIDDGGAGFVTAGTWSRVGSTGLEGDHVQAVATSGNKATWTFDGLQPGFNYRLAATWVAGADRTAAANFAVTNIEPDGHAESKGVVTLNQQLAPDDLVQHGVSWEYVGGQYLVRGNTLSVALTGADGKVLVADGVRLVREGEWIAPTGTPAPAFGINQSHYMYAGKTFNYGSGLQAYKDAGNGPYTHYVDNTKAGATDTSNPFGTAEKPRLTVPWDLPAGSVVEIHGGPYTYGGSFSYFSGKGTADKPVFIRGYSPDAMPLFQKMSIRVRGEYMIIENLKFKEVWTGLKTFSGDPFGVNHHVALRNTEMYGLPPTYATVFAVGSGRDVVLYNNYFHDNGDPNYHDENDFHGVWAGQGSQRVWIVDNHSHGHGGDSVQINSNNTAFDTWARWIYIGRNVYYADGENAVDIKQARDVIISDNRFYGYKPTNFAHSGSDGTAIVVHYNPADVWIINNEIYNSYNGIRTNGSTRGWIVGNVIHDISAPGSNPSSAWSSGAAIITWAQGELNVVGNTIYRVDAGFNSPNSLPAMSFVNNIVANLNLSGSRHVAAENSTIPANSLAYNNLFYQPGGTVRIRWGSGTYNTVADWVKSTGDGQGSMIADPLLVNMAKNDVRLQAGSPAVDTASTWAHHTNTFKSLYGIELNQDFFAMPRPSGKGLDIGAVELVTGGGVVVPGNGTPIAVDVVARVNEDESVQGTASGSDPDGDPLTFAVKTGPAHGTVTMTPAGAFTYTPNANWNGTDTFTYIAHDGKVESAPATVSIIVAPVADPATAVNDVAKTMVDIPVTIDVLANDANPDGIALTITNVTAPANGTAVLQDGKIVYTPKAGWMGDDAFAYTIADGMGGTSTATVAVRVTEFVATPEVLAPTAVEASAAEAGNGPENTLDGNLATRWSAQGDGAWIQYDLGGTKELSEVRIAWYSGDKRTSTFDLQASVDGQAWETVFSGASSGTTADFEPYALANPVGRFVRIVGHGNSVSDWNSITEVQILGLAATAPPPPQNAAPVAADDAATTTANRPVAIDVLANDTDPDGDALSVTAHSDPAHGSVVYKNGFIYTPAADWVGMDSFTYTVSDGKGETATATVTITVTAAAPEARILDVVGVTASTFQVGNGPENTLDGKLDTRWSAEGDGAWIQYDLGGDMHVTEARIAWHAGFRRAATFEVQVSRDGQAWETVYSGESCGTTGDFVGFACQDAVGRHVRIVGHGNTENAWNSISEVQLVGLDAAVDPPVNTAPVAVDDVATTVKDTPVTIDVLANDTDADGDVLYVDSFTQGTYGTVTTDESGGLVYTPGTGWAGTDSFTYVVSDGNGGTAQATVDLIVDALNVAPIAADDAFQTTQDTPVALDVLANDSDADGDVLTVVELTQPVNGVAAIADSGEISYTPRAGFIGTDTFTYTVADPAGAMATATVTVEVTKASTEQPEPGVLTVAGVTASHAETGNGPENTIDGSMTTRWSADGDGAWIQYDLGADMNVSEVRIAWHNGQKRVATFDVQVSTDGQAWQTVLSGHKSSGTTADFEGYALEGAIGRYVRLVGHCNTQNAWNSITEVQLVGTEVQVVNTAPEAVDDAAATIQGKAVTIDVLANDSDADGDALAIQAYTQGANGLVALNDAGGFTYTPTAGWSGTDTFTYTIEDGRGGTATATVTVAVAPQVLEPEVLTVAAVTASHAETGNGPENTLDGRLNTRWSADGDGAWIQYDLGTQSVLSEVRIAWHNGQKRVATFDVQVSTDGQTWQTVLGGHKSSGTTADFEGYALEGAIGRYVRIVGHCNSQNTWNSISEVQIVGVTL